MVLDALKAISTGTDTEIVRISRVHCTCVQLCLFLVAIPHPFNRILSIAVVSAVAVEVDIILFQILRYHCSQPCDRIVQLGLRTLSVLRVIVATVG